MTKGDRSEQAGRRGSRRRTSRQVSRKSERTNPGTVVAVLVAGLIALVAVCVACWAVSIAVVDRLDDDPQDETDDFARLTLAYSPEKATLVQQLIDDLNVQGYQVPDGLPMRVELVEMDPEAMLDGAVAGEFQALTPDSSVWLPQLDALWAEQVGDDRAFIVG